MGKDEVAVLPKLDAARIIESFSRRLEESNAFLAKPDVELEAPLHTEPGAVSTGGATRELTLIDNEDPGTVAALRHMPRRRQAERAGPYDKDVGGVSGHRGNEPWFASTAKGTGRASGRAVIGAVPCAPCSSASADIACKHVRPPHQPIPARVTRLRVFGVRWPAANASRSILRVTFSQRQTTVSSVVSAHRPAGTRSILWTALWKATSSSRAANSRERAVPNPARSRSRLAAAAAAPTIPPSASAASAPRNPAASPATKMPGTEVRPSSSTTGSQPPRGLS